MKISTNEIIFFFFLLVFGGLTLAYFNVPGWLDPDSYGFFNQNCHKTSDIETPILSYFVFQSLPCDEIVWKTFGFFLIFAIFSSFFYSCKKLGIPSKYSFIFGLSGYIIGFLWSPEDDLLAYPLLIASSFWLLEKPKQRIIPYAIIGLLIGSLVWKGAFLIMGLIILGVIHPLAALVGILYYSPSFFNSWGNSAEVVWGGGFVINNFILLPVLVILFLAKIPTHLKTILFTLMILVFFQPKWGEYLIIPCLAIIAVYREKIKEHENIIPIISIIMIILFSCFLFLTITPTLNQWEVINESVRIQKNGGILYNDWGIGHHLEYAGGNPSQKGGYHGYYNPREDVFYYLGFGIEFTGYNCKTINEKDGLSIQECIKNP